MRYGPNIITNGLVLALDSADKNSYPGSGTTWTDLSGNNYNGTLTNGPTFSNSNGGSIVFDGTNDYVITNNVNLSNTNSVSVDMWVKILNYKQLASSGNVLIELSSDFNSVTTGFVIVFGDDSNPIYLGTFPISLSLQGNVGYNINYWNKTLVNDLNWHHWCCIFDKSQTTPETFLYVDGVFRNGNTTTFNNNNTNNFGNLSFYFGGRSASLNSNFQLSNIKIYNKTLTATEVLQNYNATKTRFGL